MMTQSCDPVAVARQYLFVREAQGKQNGGLRVNAIQTWGGGMDGQSWCCWFATMVLDLCYQGNAPIPRGGACQDVLDHARAESMLVTDPQPGDLFLYVNDAGHAHHIGFCVSVDPLIGIAGNTSSDGTSSNGDGVYEHPLTTNPAHILFVRLP